MPQTHLQQQPEAAPGEALRLFISTLSAPPLFALRHQQFLTCWHPLCLHGSRATFVLCHQCKQIAFPGASPLPKEPKGSLTALPVQRLGNLCRARCASCPPPTDLLLLVLYTNLPTPHTSCSTFSCFNSIGQKLFCSYGKILPCNHRKSLKET